MFIFSFARSCPSSFFILVFNSPLEVWTVNPFGSFWRRSISIGPNHVNHVNHVNQGDKVGEPITPLETQLRIKLMMHDRSTVVVLVVEFGFV